MADRWMDERDRMWRDRDWRRSEQYGRGEREMGGAERERGRYGRIAGEERSWGGSADEDQGVDYGAGRYGPAGYSRAESRGYGGVRAGGGAYGAGGSYGGGESYGRSDVRGRAYRGEAQPMGGQGHSSSAWQDPDYGGVSPAMEQGEYDAERAAEHYGRERHGERRGYYGGAGRQGAYGYGGERHGAGWRGYDRRMFQGDEMASGGMGGYDYERGYGDAGRSEMGPEDRGERWERGGREAGHFFRRAGERVASWFGAGEGHRDEASSWRDEQRGFRGMGPKGYKRADERISDEVHERLTDDPWLDASAISISVSAGEVTLSGTVENREAKHRAERIVEDISGVDNVQNNLRVNKGNPLTRPASGYGDSVLEHQMRGETGSGESFDSLTGSSGSSSSGSTSALSGRPSGSASTDAGKSR